MNFKTSKDDFLKVISKYLVDISDVQTPQQILNIIYTNGLSVKGSIEIAHIQMNGKVKFGLMSALIDTENGKLTPAAIPPQVVKKEKAKKIDKSVEISEQETTAPVVDTLVIEKVKDTTIEEIKQEIVSDKDTEFEESIPELPRDRSKKDWKHGSQGDLFHRLMLSKSQKLEDIEALCKSGKTKLTLHYAKRYLKDYESGKFSSAGWDLVKDSDGVYTLTE